jgi:hypothetical protein
VVDSSFLAQADWSYGGAISDFLMQIGTQIYDQTTAFSPDIQGIELRNKEIVGVAMNWEQTSAGLVGPFTQWAKDGTCWLDRRSAGRRHPPGSRRIAVLHEHSSCPRAADLGGNAPRLCWPWHCRVSGVAKNRNGAAGTWDMT